MLSTGPVGFGDAVNKTNASLLSRAIRTDGVILKPASAALRLDRFYDERGKGAEQLGLCKAKQKRGREQERENKIDI